MRSYLAGRPAWHACVTMEFPVGFDALYRRDRRAKASDAEKHWYDVFCDSRIGSVDSAVKHIEAPMVVPAQRPPSIKRMIGYFLPCAQLALRSTLLFVVTLGLTSSGCNMTFARKPTQLSGEPETLQYADSLHIDVTRMTRTPSGLLYLDRHIGSGPIAEKGREVSVGYIGSLADGRIFDQSRPGDPIAFVLGEGEVISGWDEGIAGMKVGGRRLLVIRPSLAYGNASPGAGIPPNATLVFEVTLDRVQ